MVDYKSVFQRADSVRSSTLEADAEPSGTVARRTIQQIRHADDKHSTVKHLIWAAMGVFLLVFATDLYVDPDDAGVNLVNHVMWLVSGGLGVWWGERNRNP